jgi:hypothetical protein
VPIFPSWLSTSKRTALISSDRQGEPLDQTEGKLRTSAPALTRAMRSYQFHDPSCYNDSSLGQKFPNQRPAETSSRVEHNGCVFFKSDLVCRKSSVTLSLNENDPQISS